MVGIKNLTRHPATGNGPDQRVVVEESTRCKWVNIKLHVRWVSRLVVGWNAPSVEFFGGWALPLVAFWQEGSWLNWSKLWAWGLFSCLSCSSFLFCYSGRQFSMIKILLTRPLNLNSNHWNCKYGKCPKISYTKVFDRMACAKRTCWRSNLIRIYTACHFTKNLKTTS